MILFMIHHYTDEIYKNFLILSSYIINLFFLIIKKFLKRKIDSSNNDFIGY